MSSTTRLLTRSILVGVLIVSTTYGASALTVKRVNQLVDGAFAPVLVVTNNGTKTVHVIGQDGLTRAILFNQKKALEWARKLYGADVVMASGGQDGDGSSVGGNDGGGY